MKKITLLFIALIVTSIAVNAQKKKKVDPKHTNFFKIPSEVSTAEYTLTFSDAVARMEYCKFAVKVANNTNDFIIFDKGASIFNFEFGKFSDKKKDIVIKPNDSKKKVLEANGGEQFHVDKFNVDFDEISLVPIKGEVSNMEDFQVPASKNSISTDIFKVDLNPKKTSLKTQEASLQFECTYLGNKIAIVDPSKLVIKVDGTDKEYANDNTKSETELLLNKGDKVKIKAVFHIPGRIADMQFANMTISWKDTFVETEAKKLAGQKISFELDPGLTNGKNQ